MSREGRDMAWMLRRLAKMRANLENWKRIEAESREEKRLADSCLTKAQYRRRMSQKEVDRLAAQIRAAALTVYATRSIKNPWPGVQVEEESPIAKEPQVTIAEDLSQYLPKEEIDE